MLPETFNTALQLAPDWKTSSDPQAVLLKAVSNTDAYSSLVSLEFLLYFSFWHYANLTQVMPLQAFVGVYSNVDMFFPTAEEYLMETASPEQLVTDRDPANYYVLLNGNNRFAIKKLGAPNWVWALYKHTIVQTFKLYYK